MLAKNYFYHAERIKRERSPRILSSFFVPSILIASLNSYLRQATRTLDRSLGKRAEYKVRVLAIFITQERDLLRSYSLPFEIRPEKVARICKISYHLGNGWKKRFVCFFPSRYLSYVTSSTTIRLICPFRIIKTFHFIRRFSYVSLIIFRPLRLLFASSLSKITNSHVTYNHYNTCKMNAS